MLRYSRIAVVLHWAIALVLFAEVVLGWWMLDVPKAPPGLRAGWFNLHKSIGLTIALIVLARMAWRATHVMADADFLAPWQRTVAQLTHGLLYGCMLVMPVTGYLGSTFTRYPVKYFGMVLPSWNHDWPAAKQLMADVHYATACVFVALVALHVAAALWHWLQHDGVTARMRMPSLR